MNSLITLIMIIVTSPTLLDRSNLTGNCEVTASRRSITQERINDGFVQGEVTLDMQNAIGLTDNNGAAYDPCNQSGERFFTTNWVVSASVSPSEGLSVIENGKTVYSQHEIYEQPQAVIKVQHKATTLTYLLNGRVLFQSTHAGLASRDLRGYYFGQTQRPLIGTPRINKPLVLNRLRRFWLD